MKLSESGSPMFSDTDGTPKIGDAVYVVEDALKECCRATVELQQIIRIELKRKTIAVTFVSGKTVDSDDPVELFSSAAAAMGRFEAIHTGWDAPSLVGLDADGMMDEEDRDDY